MEKILADIQDNQNDSQEAKALQCLKKPQTAWVRTKKFLIFL